MDPPCLSARLGQWAQVRLARKAGTLRGFHGRIDRTKEIRLEKGSCESNLVGRA